MFYRTSLQIQQLFAEMFHLAVALRTIVGPSDVERMPLIQKRVAAEAIQAARTGLNCCLRSNSYREGLKYGIQTFLGVNESKDSLLFQLYNTLTSWQRSPPAS